MNNSQPQKQIPSQSSITLSKKERKELRRQQKQEERARQQKKQAAKRLGRILILVGLVIGVAVGIYWLIQSQPEISDQDIVTRHGIHWHPHLSVVIKGDARIIPANIGITAAEHPTVIHTHDETGTLHLEFQGLVLKEQLKLKNFFKVWGKRFDRNCIFEFCNGENGQVEFFVNGQENQEFENYIMRDGDRIEIRYE